MSKKQKQQTISRFFSPKPPNPNPNPTPPPKPTTTVAFSPSTTSAKRSLSKALTPPTKRPRNPPPHTPLELQFLRLKSSHPDLLLAVEVGYKFRFFSDHASAAARVLGIVAHPDRNFLTASIPAFRLHVHVRRLVAAGFKVGVVRQTETAAMKARGENKGGAFERELAAVYTRATIEAAEDLGGEVGEGEGGSGYLACVVEKGLPVDRQGGDGGFDVKVGVVAVEISSGDVVYGEFKDNVMRSGVESVLLSLSPAEILIGTPVSDVTEKLLLAYAGSASNVRIERTSYDFHKDGGALAELISLYESVADDSPKLVYPTGEGQSLPEVKHFGVEEIMAMPELAVQALALTVRYLKQFGFERILCLGSSFRPLTGNSEMMLSANALHELEIVKNKCDGSVEGSLLQVMDHTYTSFGSRLLKHWVTHPLCDRVSISARLDAVSEIADSMGSGSGSNQVVLLDEEPLTSTDVQSEISHLLSSVLGRLGKVSDVQRGIMRIFYLTATPAEVISVIHAILLAGKQLQKLHSEERTYIEGRPHRTVQSALLRRLISTASSSMVMASTSKLLSCLNKEAADRKDMLNLLNTSTSDFPEVAEKRTMMQIIQEKLDLLILEYRRKFGMPKLEFLSVSGSTHLIELLHNVKVPPNWVMVNSTKKTTRYHSPEVIKALDDLALAKEELAVACRDAWKSFLVGFGKYYAQFQAVVQALASLDCLHSLAIVSSNKNYVRPIFVGDDDPSQLEILFGRHPVLESILHDNFVPNDTNLHALGEHCQIIMGPNMGGKSSYIRQVALITIMAQIGSFVPASSVRLHVLDGIYTRIGFSDSIQQGKSTFFEELSETSYLLQRCSSRSLVIVDELGRGTSTHDGVAIAYATLHYILKQKRCMVLFVTHYPKLLDIQHEFSGSVGAYHVSYLTSPNPLTIDQLEHYGNTKSLDLTDITFLYKVVPGVYGRSFGLNVARLAQLPLSCIARAVVMASELEMEISGRTRKHLVQNGDTRLAALPSNIGASGYSVQPGDSYQPSTHFNEFAESFNGFLCLLQPVLSDTHQVDVLSSLKEIKKIALSIMEEGKIIAIT